MGLCARCLGRAESSRPDIIETVGPRRLGPTYEKLRNEKSPGGSRGFREDRNSNLALGGGRGRRLDGAAAAAAHGDDGEREDGGEDEQLFHRNSREGVETAGSAENIRNGLNSKSHSRPDIPGICHFALPVAVRRLRYLTSDSVSQMIEEFAHGHPPR